MYVEAFEQRERSWRAFGTVPQRTQNHFRLCAAPTGRLCHGTKFNGSETRSAQTVLARMVEFGAAAKPRTKAGKILKKRNKLPSGMKGQPS